MLLNCAMKADKVFAKFIWNIENMYCKFCNGLADPQITWDDNYDGIPLCLRCEAVQPWSD